MNKILNIAAFTMAVLVAGCSNSDAAEFKSKEDLIDYYLEEFPNGSMLSVAYELGQTLEGKWQDGSCKTKKSLFSVDLPASLLIQNRLIRIRFANDHGGPWEPCQYEITGFSDATDDRWKDFEISIRSAEDFVDKVTIPLARQDLLGMDDVKLNGHRDGFGRHCDVKFGPWYRNYEPSAFVRHFRRDFERAYQYKNVFSSEYTTKRHWCFKRKYDGTLIKDEWPRLY